MSDVAAYIQRAAERLKFTREAFVERNIPTQMGNVLAIPFYGDFSSLGILSSLILRSYKERYKDKYIILCSWPGFHALFPYVDEYWSFSDDSVNNTLATGADYFYNNASLAAELSRGLLECFNILTSKDLLQFYHNGFTTKYFEEFGDIKRYLPEIPSISRVSQQFHQQLGKMEGQKLLVFPVRRMTSWQKGKSVRLPVSSSFWSGLLTTLLEAGVSPVIWQNWFTYDMSREFVDKCVYLVPRNVADVLAAIRHIGLVLDVHSGVSKLALAARTPFLSVEERARFFGTSEYIINGLMSDGIPQRYIFSFSTMLMVDGLQEWKTSVLDQVLVYLREMSGAQSSEWGNAKESFDLIPNDKVKRRVARHMGVHFIGKSRMSQGA